MSPTPPPGSMPKKGPRPTAKPVPVQSPSKNDPAKWGRVDADGSVFVSDPEGERKIGEWQAGSAEEGLEHFGAR